MSEYIIRVDEDDQRWHYVQKQYEHFFGYPLVDEIVRCRDCKYYGCYDGSTWCSRTYEQVLGGTCDYQTVDPDGFCAWGDREVDA